MRVRIENFSEKELACPCCGKNKVTDKALIMLQTLRYLCDFPLKISSGFRCEKYNKQIKGARSSKHMSGVAFDIKRLSTKNVALLTHHALNLGFKGAGIYDQHVHLDIRPCPALWVGTSK